MQDSQLPVRAVLEVQKLASQAGVTIPPHELPELVALFIAGTSANTETERTSAGDALMDRLTPGWRETEIEVRDSFAKMFDLRYAAYKGGEPITKMDDSGYSMVTSFSNDADIWRRLLASAPGHLTIMDKLCYRLFKKLPRWAIPTRKDAKPGVPVSGTWPKSVTAGLFEFDKKVAAPKQ